MGDYELYHARSHKYIKKIGNRYFYSQAEIQAFYGKDKTKQSIADVDNIKDFKSGKTTWVSGSPKRQLYSITLGPLAVSIRPK